MRGRRSRTDAASSIGPNFHGGFRPHPTSGKLTAHRILTTTRSGWATLSAKQMASAKDVDARTDIWAIGTILYELLTGAPPFNGDTLPQLCAMVLQQEPEPLLARRPELPSVAAEVVARCLKKDPKERYADVAELARELMKLAPRSARLSVERISRIMNPGRADAAATALPPSSVSPPPQRPGHATAVSWGETAPEPPTHSRGPWIAAGVAALGLAIGGIIVLRSALAGDAPAAAPAPTLAASRPPAPVPEPGATTPLEPSAAPACSSRSES